MGVTAVPQWLPAAFVRSALAVGASAGRDEIEATCRRLLERWQEPDRHFHNVRHLVDMLARVDELAEETHDPDLVRLAAWYHGAVFNSGATKTYARSGGEDEAASAELARAELGSLGVPGPALDRITELILGLKRHETAGKDIDCLALSDADLAVLAADPQKYQAYRKKVRAEYAHIPLRHYLEARIAIIRKLLARRAIFASPMGQQWEDAARENLSAELTRLEAELAALGECAPEETVAAAEAEVAQAERSEQTAPSEDAAGDVRPRAEAAPTGERGGVGSTEEPVRRRSEEAATAESAAEEDTVSSLEALPEEREARPRAEEPRARPEQDRPAVEEVPQSGIEREPDIFTRPRKKKGGRRG